MDREDMSSVWRVVAFITGIALITVVFITVLIKVEQSLFPKDYAHDLTWQSMEMCRNVHGTPVLEADGAAYKSCAINGKSETHNTVR